MKGFAGGLLVGLVFSAAALTGLSLLAPAPQHAVGRTGTPSGNTAQAPVGATPVVVAEGAAPAPIAGREAPTTATDPVPEALSDEAASTADAPEIAAENTAEPPADVPPVPAPAADAPEADAAAPANPDAPDSSIPADAQPAPGADDLDSPAPPPPAAEEQVALAEPSADQPAPPQAVPEAQPLPPPDSPPLAAPEANPQPQGTEPDLPEPAQAASETPQPDLNAPASTSPERAAPEAAPLESGTAQVATSDTATTEDAAPPQSSAPDPTSASPSPEATQAPEPAPTTESPQEPATAPDTLTPAPSEPTLPGTSTVRVNRLGAEPAEEPPAEEPESEALPEDTPALLRYAAAFEPPAEDRPLVSLILLDEGQAPADAAALSAMPVPVSVAIDPSLPDAAERLAAYRDAGIEALLVASLPDGALPQDAAVFLEGGLRELPETVALLDLGQGGLNARNATASMGLSMAARDGRGVVLVSQGFNAGLAAAQGAGIPAAEIQRDLDGEGQDTIAIRRGLDDAVRRAGQAGGVVLLGRVRPQTLDAVTEWTSQGRAQEVTVAPVSALLAPTLSTQKEPSAP